MTYICSWGVVNCPQCMPEEARESVEDRELQRAQLAARVAAEGGDVESVTKDGKFQFNRRMRPCGSTSPCSCFGADDYSWDRSQKCAVMAELNHKPMPKKLNCA